MIRITPAIMCSVMNAMRVDNARTTRSVTHPAVNATALFPGAPPIHGKSFRKSSGPEPFR